MKIYSGAGSFRDNFLADTWFWKRKIFRPYESYAFRAYQEQHKFDFENKQ